MHDNFAIFSAMPGASGLIRPDAPDFTIVACTGEFAEIAGISQDELCGRSIFAAFAAPHNPAFLSDVKASLSLVIKTRKPQELLDQRYDETDRAGDTQEMYWKVILTPVPDSSGAIEYIIFTAFNTTQKLVSSVMNERIRALRPLENLFNQTNVAIHIFRGHDMVIEMANKPTQLLWGRDASVVGRPLLEVLPELLDTPYPGIIRGVQENNKTYTAFDAEVPLHREGRTGKAYFNFVLQPYYENGDAVPVGVIGMVTEVTDLHNSRIELQEAERSLELASEIGDLGTFNVNSKTLEISCSPQVMQWFGLSVNQVPLAEILLKVYPDDTTLVAQTLRTTVKDQGLKHNIVFRVINEETGQLYFLRSIGQLQIENGEAVAVSGIIQDITNSVRSQEAIAESAQRMRNLIHSAPFPIGVYMGREMRIEMANQSIIDVWGKGSDIIGKTYHEVLPELANTGIYEALDKVFTDGIPFQAHNQQIELIVDGLARTFYFNYAFTPLFDADGSIYGVMNTAADVTDLNMATRTIEESEARYRTLIEESPVAAALYIGPDIKVQYANDIMLSFWGKDRSILGLSFEDAIPELNGQSFIDFLKNVYQSGMPYYGSQEPVYLDKGQGLRAYYFNFTYKPLVDVDGVIYGIHHTAVDVTEEVLTKKALEESERNLRNMIQQAPLAICILWGNYHVFGNINPMMEQMLGRPVSEIEGKPIFEAMPELVDSGLQPILDRAIQGERYISEEQEFHLPRNGVDETQYIKYIYEPLKDTSGNIEAIMVVASDFTHEVTARRKIEDVVASRTQELADANQRLQQSNAELEQFAYIASHDLQEPLRKISMFTQLLESNLGQLNDRAKHQIDRINNSVSRMSNLIRDILGYSAVSHKDDGFVPVELEDIVREAAQDFELVLQEKKGMIAISGLPVVEAIPLQMHQLFGNLISNSLKYSKDSEPPHIAIDKSKVTSREIALYKLPGGPDDYTAIVFQDNGIGFSQEYAEK
ncbi:MAG: PAS domain S-box protein, partial [Sphingobacteriales bacterium]